MRQAGRARVFRTKTVLVRCHNVGSTAVILASVSRTYFVLHSGTVLERYRCNTGSNALVFFTTRLPCQSPLLQQFTGTLGIRSDRHL